MDKDPTIKFCSGVGTVTGANFLLDTGKSKILVDCGMIQGESFAEEANREQFSYDPRSIDVLVVTHAHLDHVGRIPRLVKEGFVGKIYSTPQTMELAKIVLEDAARLLTDEAEQRGWDPIYRIGDVAPAFDSWQTVEYHQSTKISDDVAIYLKDAGHILGSAMVEASVGSGNATKKILFTGDLGNSPSPLLCDTEEVGEVDYMVMESAYGDRNHEPKETRLSRFENIINQSIERGGALVIPTFSVDRTQTLLYELNNLVESGRVLSVPIFLDSPMATKATEIYRSNTDLFNDKVKEQIRNGDDVFSFPKLKFTVTSLESKEISKESGPKIILAGSGMSAGGRVIGHEINYLPDPKSTILLVGYQSLGSLGRELADGVDKVHIRGENVRVKAKIETLYGYSAHKGSDDLVDFVSTAKGVKKVFVAMGEPKASMFLAQRINNELHAQAIVPEAGVVFDLK